MCHLRSSFPWSRLEKIRARIATIPRKTIRKKTHGRPRFFFKKLCHTRAWLRITWKQQGETEKAEATPSLPKKNIEKIIHALIRLISCAVPVFMPLFISFFFESGPPTTTLHLEHKQKKVRFLWFKKPPQPLTREFFFARKPYELFFAVLSVQLPFF